jgi:hypothetical protein
MSPVAEPAHDELLHWVERLTGMLVREGMPPIAGRALGWLMVCDPPEQSAGQLGAAIGASPASLTTNLRLLIAMGLVNRRTRTGERVAYYRVEDDAWQRVISRQVATVASYGELAEDGLTLVGPDSARAGRLQDLRAAFCWMARVFAEAAPPPEPGANWKAADTKG